MLKVRKISRTWLSFVSSCASCDYASAWNIGPRRPLPQLPNITGKAQLLATMVLGAFVLLSLSLASEYAHSLYWFVPAIGAVSTKKKSVAPTRREFFKKAATVGAAGAVAAGLMHGIDSALALPSSSQTAIEDQWANENIAVILFTDGVSYYTRNADTGQVTTQSATTTAGLAEAYALLGQPPGVSTSVTTQGSPTIWIKGGQYTYSATTNFTTGLRITGEGRNRTMFVPSGSGLTWTNIGGAAGVNSNLVIIEDLKIGNNGVSIAGTGIAWTNNSGVGETQLRGLEIRDLSTNALSGTINVGYNTFTDCWFGSPINLTGTDAMFTFCRFFNSVSSPVMLLKFNDLNFNSNWIQNANIQYAANTFANADINDNIWDCTTNSQTLLSTQSLGSQRTQSQIWVNNNCFAATGTTPTLFNLGNNTTNFHFRHNVCYPIGAASWTVTIGTTCTYDIVNNPGYNPGFAEVGLMGATSQKAETQAADANVLTLTPVAAAGSYRIRVAATVSAANVGVIGFTISYKDSNGNTVTTVAMSIFQLATAGPALTFTTSAASRYYGEAQIDIDNSATNIVVAWVGGGTSTTAKVSATIEELV